MDTLLRSARLRRLLPRPLRPTLRIAVVGSGPVSPDAGDEIDAHDLVVRFNGCENYGIAGRRIDVLVLVNSGGSGKHLANSPEAINLAAWASAREFWLRAPPEILESMAAAHPDQAADVWEDHTKDMLVNRVGIRPWQIISEQTYWAAHRTLKLNIREGQQPSTGMLALFHIRRAFRPCVASLYGFTHQGWKGHPWADERSLIDAWRDWVVRR